MWSGLEEVSELDFEGVPDQKIKKVLGDSENEKLTENF